METTRNPLQATFVLHRFERSAPGVLEVIGRWAGIEVHELGEVVLVLGDQHGVARVAALPYSAGGTVNSWHVAFPWKGDTSTIQTAALEIGGAFVVQLPPQVPARRRLAGTTLRVRPASEEAPAGRVPADAMGLHRALVATLEEREALRERLEVAQADLRRAREDAEREHARRQAEAERHHEALEGLRGVAQEAVQREREAAQERTAQLRADVDRLEAELHDARQATGEVRALRSALADARHDADAAQAEAQRLRDRLAEVRRAFDPGH